MKITRRTKLLFWIWDKRLSLIYNRKFRDRIKRWFILYDPEDFQVGGHCGICGEWVKDDILPKAHSWTLCSECVRDGKGLDEENC